MTICKTLWQHFTRIQDRAKKKENFHLCAMHGHKSLCLKSREASSKVRVFVVSQERGGGVVGKGGRGVAGSKANIFGKMRKRKYSHQGETTASRSGKHFFPTSDNWQWVRPSRFSTHIFHPEFASVYLPFLPWNRPFCRFLFSPLPFFSYFLNAFLLFNFKLRLQFYFAISTLSPHRTPSNKCNFPYFSQFFPLLAMW